MSGFGFRVVVLGLRISSLGFRVSGFGFRVSSFGSRVLGFGSTVNGGWNARKGDGRAAVHRECPARLWEGEQRVEQSASNPNHSVDQRGFDLKNYG